MKIVKDRDGNRKVVPSLKEKYANIIKLEDIEEGKKLTKHLRGLMREQKVSMKEMTVRMGLDLVELREILKTNPMSWNIRFLRKFCRALGYVVRINFVDYND